MAKEILFQLPGQGNHSLGMGKDLWDSGDKYFRELLQIGSDTAKIDLPKVIFDENTYENNLSKILQPAISAITLSLVRILAENGVVPTTVMGHSLGEITALGVVGSISPKKAVEFAAYRGVLLDESSVLCGGGTMTAILMANSESCQKVINGLNLSDKIFVANDNAPTQAVVSGKIDAIEKFEKEISANFHGVKCKRIAVSGPWHTPFINHAKEIFAEWVKNEEILSPNIKLIMNSTAKEENSTKKIREYITNQLVYPVRWRESCEYVKNTHFAAVLDVGPGKILAGLMRANKIIRVTDYWNTAANISEALSVSKEICANR